MTDPNAQIAELQTRIAAATRARMRAEHERDAAAATAETARQHLRTEFGVTDATTAAARLAELEHELAEAITTLRAELDAAGA